MLQSSSGLNLTQQIVHHLGKAIISGAYGKDNLIPSEALLCKQLNVSRSATREAVKSLAAKGLISSRARKGIRILPESEWNLFDSDVLAWMRDCNPSPALLLEFAELRIAVEPEAAWLAASQQNLEQIAQISAALARMKQAGSGLDDPLESDIAFHISIFNACGNRFFIQLGRIIDTTLRVSIRFTNMVSGAQAGDYVGHYAAHKKVYDAIVANQPAKAEKASEKLVRDALKLIVNAMEEGAHKKIK